MGQFTVSAVAGIGEVHAGDDLADAVLTSVALADGDIVVITSKIVSKAEGRLVTSPKEVALAGETDRVVATRGDTRIVRTRLGLVMAAAGIDASNTAPGTLLLLPEDPDGTARRLRAHFQDRAGVNVGVVISDTSGRAWRNGQTDIAIGAAGITALDDHLGRLDSHGNTLAVTAPALADELAGAGDLVKGKVSGCPVALVRGLARLVLPVGTSGPGAAVLIRDEAGDMFGLGAREAVAAALTGGGRRGFGGSAPLAVVRDALEGIAGAGRVCATADSAEGAVVLVRLDEDPRSAGRLEARVEALALAHGWEIVEGLGHNLLRCQPTTP